MLERLAPMFVQHFLLDECLLSSQTVVQQTRNVGQTWVLDAITLSYQQML